MHTSARSALIGGAVMTVIAASFALGRGPVPVHALRDKPFDTTLHEDLATLAMMSERVAQLDRPKVVQTESIRPIEPDPLMAVLSDPAARTDVCQTVGATVSARRTTDICTRHNMRKVYYGSTWRCRK
jgi:hypothetical protein